MNPFPASPRRRRSLPPTRADPGKVFTNPAGAECVRVGRLRNGVLGEMHGHQFRRFPADAPGVCGNAAPTGLVTAVTRRGQPERRTVVYGVSAARNPVIVELDGERHTIRPQGLGTFLLVLPGRRGTTGVVVRTTVNRQPHTITLG